MNAADAGVRNSSFVLLAVAMLAIGLDVGVARITYGVVLPAFARDLQLSLTAAGCSERFTLLATCSARRSRLRST